MWFSALHGVAQSGDTAIIDNIQCLLDVDQRLFEVHQY